MKKLGMLVAGICASAIYSAACGGSATGSGDGDGDASGDGDGDAGGDGDDSGDGDLGGDGDGDVSGDGDGDASGDGDGDVSGDGDGDVSGDGDNEPCTDHYAYGLTVVLTGGAYPPPPSGDSDASEPNAPPERILPPEDLPFLCEASAIAVDGTYSETLECYAGSPTTADCTCTGAGERPGMYTVRATWGQLTETEQVTVTADECHVIGQSLTFFDE